MASVVSQELAIRTAILDIAPTNSLLQKSNSPGRLYHSITTQELATAIEPYLSGGSNVTVNGVVQNTPILVTIDNTDILNGFITIPHTPILNSEEISIDGMVLNKINDYSINTNIITFVTDWINLFEVGDTLLIRYKYAV